MLNRKLIQNINKSVGFAFSTYSTTVQGEGFEKRVFLSRTQGQSSEEPKRISFWNDIPLYERANGRTYLNAGIKIPRFTLAKMEVCKTEEGHPLKQDTRKSKIDKSKIELRYYAQFPLFNYGFLPQTWESSLAPGLEGLLGDDDPLDIVELSSDSLSMGSIQQVEVLGSFLLIDEGEMDWKIIGMNRKEAEEKKIHSLEDLEKAYPGRLQSMLRWFKYIKTYDGKKENELYKNGKFFTVDQTMETVDTCYKHWKELLSPELASPKLREKLEAKKREFMMKKD